MIIKNFDQRGKPNYFWQECLTNWAAHGPSSLCMHWTRLEDSWRNTMDGMGQSSITHGFDPAQPIWTFVASAQTNIQAVIV